MCGGTAGSSSCEMNDIITFVLGGFLSSARSVWGGGGSGGGEWMGGLEGGGRGVISLWE